MIESDAGDEVASDDEALQLDRDSQDIAGVGSAPVSGSAWTLTIENVALGEGMEPAANPVQLRSADELAEEGDAIEPSDDLDPAVLAELADNDPSWVRSNGTRYEAMLVLEDGSAYGRLGPATDADVPHQSNGYGSFVGEKVPLGFAADEPSEEDINQGILALEAATQSGQAGQAGQTGDAFTANVEQLPGILGGSLSSDRRTRVTNTTTLQGFPERTIGALNGTQAAGRTGCTGTKVGPRHVLTASHCVLSSSGAWTTSGWFHPGQTNSTHPNTNGTAVRWSGVYARDWRNSRRWDYALLYLEDRLDSFQLGWLGVTWWNSQSGYTGVLTRILGYPARTATSNANRCNASVLSPKNCDGWMYRDTRALESNAFRSDEQLQYDIDTTTSQSGSSAMTQLSGGSWVTLGVHWGCAGFGGCSDVNRNKAARFRSSMWNDICGWIAQVPSTHGQHSLCS